MQTVPSRPISVHDPRWRELMIGGFMGVGTPERVIDEIVRQSKRGLIIIANDTAVPGRGNRQVIGANLYAKPSSGFTSASIPKPSAK